MITDEWFELKGDRKFSNDSSIISGIGRINNLSVMIIAQEKGRGYYFLDTEELTTGLYDIWFTMEFGGNTYVSSKQQLQLY